MYQTVLSEFHIHDIQNLPRDNQMENNLKSSLPHHIYQENQRQLYDF